MNRRHYNHYELQDGLFGASGGIMMVFTILICFLINVIGILLGISLWKNDIGTFIAVGLIILFYVFLHYTLLSKDKWRKYEKEFEAYSRKKNRRINRTIIVSVILLFALLIFSFIIWKVRYDAGLIV
jgi:hypothetical protein